MWLKTLWSNWSEVETRRSKLTRCAKSPKNCGRGIPKSYRGLVFLRECHRPRWRCALPKESHREQRACVSPAPEGDFGEPGTQGIGHHELPAFPHLRSHSAIAAGLGETEARGAGHH